ncbi:hypothetical protein SAMD00023353_10900090 [Rosellinia necatrix]|uniref:Uncharacterized protein n=1 Tax=Rosellinia necatrix TaxID=77044 RepID=A0A1W2TWV3_ROSNE|nr:hypothetical protein SAMD00023353_10900090 [Rosellinia necatrix]
MSTRSQKNVAKELGRPRQVNLDTRPELNWPAWKFGLEVEDLANGLHDEYNTLRVPIQCQRAFHLDVNDAATKASTSDEFHRLMSERSMERFREIEQTIDDISMDMIGSPGQFINEDLWYPFICFVRAMSVADMIIFFTSICQPNYHTDSEKSATPPPEAFLTMLNPLAIQRPPEPTVPAEPAPLPEPYSPPRAPPSPPDPQPQQKTKRRARAKRQSTENIVRYNLRPRPAGTSQRKEQRRNPARKKRA